MKEFSYIGPPELRASVQHTARFLIQNAEDVEAWARTQQPNEPLVATFVVDEGDNLWLADRRTEHIACSRGQSVLAAGELGFETAKTGVQVTQATNQSTGFCPRVDSWAALERALDAAGLAHPAYWTQAFEFRRCEGCGALNLVKDEWFVCAHCDADLPLEWNVGNDEL